MAMPAAVTLSDCDCSMCRAMPKSQSLTRTSALGSSIGCLCRIVGQARPGADEHDVIGLDVAMDDAAAMGLGKGASGVGDDVKREFFGQLLVPFQHFAEALPL